MPTRSESSSGLRRVTGITARSETLDMASNYRARPQDSDRFDTLRLHSFGPVITVLAYSELRFGTCFGEKKKDPIQTSSLCCDCSSIIQSGLSGLPHMVLGVSHTSVSLPLPILRYPSDFHFLPLSHSYERQNPEHSAPRTQ